MIKCANNTFLPLTLPWNPQSRRHSADDNTIGISRVSGVLPTAAGANIWHSKAEVSSLSQVVTEKGTTPEGPFHGLPNTVDLYFHRVSPFSKSLYALSILEEPHEAVDVGRYLVLELR